MSQIQNNLSDGIQSRFELTVGFRTKHGDRVTVREMRIMRLAVGSAFQSYTETRGYGSWNGTREQVLRFEIVASSTYDLEVKQLGRVLREIAKQDCVLYSETRLDSIELL